MRIRTFAAAFVVAAVATIPLAGAASAQNPRTVKTSPATPRSSPRSVTATRTTTSTADEDGYACEAYFNVPVGSEPVVNEDNRRLVRPGDDRPPRRSRHRRRHHHERAHAHHDRWSSRRSWDRWLRSAAGSQQRPLTCGVARRRAPTTGPPHSGPGVSVRAVLRGRAVKPRSRHRVRRKFTRLALSPQVRGVKSVTRRVTGSRGEREDLGGVPEPQVASRGVHPLPLRVSASS